MNYNELLYYLKYYEKWFFAHKMFSKVFISFKLICNIDNYLSLEWQNQKNCYFNIFAFLRIACSDHD